MAPATSEHREKRVRTNPAARIYVGGIPPEADLHDLGSFFGCFGKVLDINLIKVSLKKKQNREREKEKWAGVVLCGCLDETMSRVEVCGVRTVEWQAR